MKKLLVLLIATSAFAGGGLNPSFWDNKEMAEGYYLIKYAYSISAVIDGVPDSLHVGTITMVYTANPLWGSDPLYIKHHLVPEYTLGDKVYYRGNKASSIGDVTVPSSVRHIIYFRYIEMRVINAAIDDAVRISNDRKSQGY